MVIRIRLIAILAAVCAVIGVLALGLPTSARADVPPWTKGDVTLSPNTGTATTKFTMSTTATCPAGTTYWLAFLADDRDFDPDAESAAIGFVNQGENTVGGNYDPTVGLPAVSGLDFTNPDPYGVGAGLHRFGYGCLADHYVAMHYVVLNFSDDLTTSGATWTVVNADPVVTTTTLTASPAAGKVGVPTTFTVSVAPATAVGSVSLSAGVSVIGDPVALDGTGDGTATVSYTPNGEGSLNVTASFTPTDPLAFAPSDSAPLTYPVAASDTPDPNKPTLAYTVTTASGTVVTAGTTVPSGTALTVSATVTPAAAGAILFTAQVGSAGSQTLGGDTGVTVDATGKASTPYSPADGSVLLTATFLPADSEADPSDPTTLAFVVGAASSPTATPTPGDSSTTTPTPGGPADPTDTGSVADPTPISSGPGTGGGAGGTGGTGGSSGASSGGGLLASTGVNTLIGGGLGLLVLLGGVELVVLNRRRRGAHG